MPIQAKLDVFQFSPNHTPNPSASVHAILFPGVKGGKTVGRVKTVRRGKTAGRGETTGRGGLHAKQRQAGLSVLAAARETHALLFVVLSC